MMDKPQDYYKVGPMLKLVRKTVDGPISHQNYPLKNVVDTGFNVNRGKQPNIAQCSET